MADARTIAAHFVLIAATAIWATGMTFLTDLAPVASPVGVVATMFLLAAPILLALSLPRWRAVARPARIVPTILAWGMIAPGMVIAFSSVAAVRLDGLVINTFLGLLPLAVVLFAFLLLKERVPVSLPFGGALALFGFVSVAVIRQAELGAPLASYAAMLGALSAATFSAVFGRYVMRNGPPATVGAALQVTGAALSTSLFVAMTDGAFFVPADPVQTAQLVFLVLGLGVANYLAFNMGLSHLHAGWVALYAGLIPAFGALIAAIRGDAPDLATWLLVTCVVVGVTAPHAERIVRSRR